MKVNKHTTTTVITDENEVTISTRIVTSYMIYPDEGKLLKNIKTGFTTDSYIGVGSKAEISDYEEIDIEII